MRVRKACIRIHKSTHQNRKERSLSGGPAVKTPYFNAEGMDSLLNGESRFTYADAQERNEPEVSPK